MPRKPSLVEFEAALFDVDGTLFDSLYGIVRGLQDTIRHFSDARPTDPEIKTLIGLPLARQMALYAPDSNAVPAMVAFAIERMKDHTSSHVFFEEAVDCLRLCHANGLKTALVTSKNSFELAAFLPQFACSDLVDAAVCASDVHFPKPNPESALLAAKKLEVSPQSCVMIGDSIYDIQCGRGAGMSCVAVSYGAGSFDALKAEQPDLLFETPAALLDWAQQSFSNRPCHLTT